MVSQTKQKDVIWKKQGANANYLNGNVGIGTSSPAGKLDVRDGSFDLSDTDVDHGLTDLAPTNSYGQIEPNNATAGGLYIQGISDTDATGLQIRGIIGDTDPTDTTSAVDIVGAKDNGTTSNTVLDSSETVMNVRNAGTVLTTTLGNGNTGFGIDSPSSKLHVKGTQSLQLARIQSSTETAGHLAGLSFTVGSDPASKASIALEADNSWGRGDLLFMVDDTADVSEVTVADERMRITRAGNVGIGTTSPDTILDINGAFTFREKSSDPANPDEGAAVLWMSDGTGTGDDGDILIKITAGATTKTITLVDFSAA
jgi:hypothetical protein